MKRMGIFVFYDEAGLVDGYVEFLLESMRGILQKLVIIINGEAKDAGYNKLEKYTKYIYIRKNLGYDGGAYKDAFTIFLSHEELLQWDEIVLFNDSFYGPLYPWKNIFFKMEKENADFWGLSRNMEAAWQGERLPEHIQSYFLVCKKSMFSSEAWKVFWCEMKYPQTFHDAVINFEVQFSAYFESKGFKSNSLVNNNEMVYAGNPFFRYPGELIIYEDFPIIKRKAIRFDSFMSIKKALENKSDSIEYDVNLISLNLKRLYMENRADFGIPFPFSLTELDQFYDNHRRIYIYGYGNYGKQILIYFECKSWKYEGIIVTENKENINGISEYRNMVFRDNDGIILALGRKAMSEVYPVVKENFEKSQLLLPQF